MNKKRSAPFGDEKSAMNNPWIRAVIGRDESLACGRGMTDCERIGVAGLCGPTCYIFQDGECEHQDEVEMTELKRGTQILYIPHHANGDENHPDVEVGFVTSQRGDTVFCRYWSKYEQDELRTKANSEGTPIDCIVVKDSMPQEIVDAALKKIEEWDAEMSRLFS